MTFAHGVNRDHAWPTLVQQRLERSRLINLALPGGAPQQYVRIYEAYGRALEPRILIVGLFPGNDLKDAAEFDAWLESGAGGNYKLWQYFRVSSPGLRYLLAGLVKRSYVFALLLDRVRWLRSEVGNGTRVFIFNDGTYTVLLPRYLENMSEKGQPGTNEFHLVMQSVERLNKLAEENGADCVFIIFPTKEEIYLPLMGNGYEADPSAAIREGLKQLGLTYLDLAPEFRKAAMAGRRLYFEQDGHPNATGNALVAKVVVDHLRANAMKYGLTDREAE